MEPLVVELLSAVLAAVLWLLYWGTSRYLQVESAPGPNHNQHPSPEYPESSAATGNSSKMKSLRTQIVKNSMECTPDEVNVIVEKVNPESSDANLVMTEVVETNQLPIGNNHECEIDFQCDNGNTLILSESSLQQFEEKLNALLLENNELKNRNCVLATNLEDMTWQKNNWLSERDLQKTESKTLQEECYEYRRISEEALRENSALQARLEAKEKEREELEMKLELSEMNVAQCKANFQQLQAALTAEYMRSAIDVQEERNERQTQKNNWLSERYSLENKVKTLQEELDEYRRISEDALRHARQEIQIAELEDEIDFNGENQVPLIPQTDANATKRRSKLKTFKAKIHTSMTSSLIKLRSIYPSKISNWFTRPLRVFPNL